MKIKPEHLAAMRKALQPIITAYPFSTYEQAGLSGRRYRWDMIRLSNLSWCGDGVGTHSDLDLYSYLDDSHIDSALRDITGTK